jgi:hypothetical protein
MLNPPMINAKAIVFRITAILGIGLALFEITAMRDLTDFVICSVFGGLCWHFADSCTLEMLVAMAVTDRTKKGEDDDEHTGTGPQSFA